MSLYYRTLIQSGRLLDQYPNARVGYSLRKLRDGYTGSAIRVRRSVDSVEQDFGFDSSGNLDTSPLLDFVGYNLWTFSEEWDNGVWTKSGLNTTATPPYVNVEVAPDGTTTADKITENTISQEHLTSRQLLVTTGVTYNVSVYLKYGGRNARVISTLDIANTYTVDVNLLTGTLSNNTFPITPILEDVGSGWYRLSYQVTASNFQTRNVITINLLNPTGSPSPINYLGDGVSGIFIWGAQATATSLVRIYNKTVATANAGNGFIRTWYDQSGNGINAIQTTPSTIQATIVSNGSVVVDPNNLRISSLWTQSYYFYSSSVGAPSQTTISAFVFNRPNNGGRQASFGNSSVGGRPTYFYWDNNNDIRIALGPTIINFLDTDNLNTGSFLSINQRNSSNVTSGYLNGAALPNTGVQAASTSPNTFGKMTSGVISTSGYIQECILWNQNYLPLRTGIEQNINTYYGIY